MELEKRNKKMQSAVKSTRKCVKAKFILSPLEEKSYFETAGQCLGKGAHCLDSQSDTHTDGSGTLQRAEGDGESVPEKGIEYSYSADSNMICNSSARRFNVNIELDVMSLMLFLAGLMTRMYRLEEPRSIVFDELHYGKYVSLYMKRTFFFDSHPPFGKQLIAAVAYLAGFDGQFRFDRIGSSYPEAVPLFALRLVPAVCGSLIIPTTYHLMLELGLTQWTAALAGFLLLCDNAMLAQSRFILMESMLLLFAIFGLLCILKFRRYHSHPYCMQWWLWLSLGAASLTCAVCVKYVGFFSCCLGASVVARDCWRLLSDRRLSDGAVLCQLLSRLLVLMAIPAVIYLTIFYIHLAVLSRAGPHDSVMTSAFQASLEGGLASITRGQPLEVAHGSQITLRHSHGRTCWLHSHTHVYPIRYRDKRGSSHQQQVTCYSFKDVNNWWIVKRPQRNDLVVSQPVDAIRHGDVIQLVHGMTSRALNSHDVAAAMSPQNQMAALSDLLPNLRLDMLHTDNGMFTLPELQLRGMTPIEIHCQLSEICAEGAMDVIFPMMKDSVRGRSFFQSFCPCISDFRGLNRPPKKRSQWPSSRGADVVKNVCRYREVSCYIDYNVSMPAQNLWRIDIINRDQVGDIWHTIESLVRLVHVNSSQALKFSGRQLPDWGFNQHEVVTDRILHQDDTVWNVEEHRYTKNEDQKDRERELVNAEMIPLRATSLSFWEKFIELQYKMLFANQENVQNHMYSSEPLEWPFMSRGIAYWVSPHSNAQVHLLGNVVVWLSGSVSIVLYGVLLTFYLIRRRRQCYDLTPDSWRSFVVIGEVLLSGYLFHYVPYFFVERTLFLHHYLPAFTFKVLLMAAVIEHLHRLLCETLSWHLGVAVFKLIAGAWLVAVLVVFRRFSVLSYGTTPLSAADILRLRWMDSWDFILHRQ